MGQCIVSSIRQDLTRIPSLNVCVIVCQTYRALREASLELEEDAEALLEH